MSKSREVLAKFSKRGKSLVLVAYYKNGAFDGADVELNHGKSIDHTHVIRKTVFSSISLQTAMIEFEDRVKIELKALLED